MKKKFTSLLVTILLVLAPFAGSLYAETSISLPLISYSIEQKLEAYVELLCSDTFGGRKPGSFGNTLAVDWLSGMLEGIGIAPYENDYRMGFNTKCYNHQKLEMTVYQKDGTVRSLVSGKDFYIHLTSSFDVKLNKEDISFISVGDTVGNETSGYIFREVPTFNATSYSGIRTPQNVQINSDTFRYLTETEIKYIHIINKIAMEEKEVYNVVGIIPGTNRDKAVVLSAHFDHMGQIGESIFRGAMDNASGTAALLCIAEKLFQMSEETPFDFDIIIAFSNDEENGLNGSASLAPLFKEVYTNLFNINIDCVGIGGSDTVYVLSYSPYKTLVEDIKLYMDKYDILYNNDGSTFTYLPSDGSVFENNRIPSVSFIGAFIGGELLVDYYHTPLDTPDKLDYSQIANLCQMIIEFIADNGSKFYGDRRTFSTGITLLPDSVNLKFSEVIKKVKSGDEAYFDEELVSYMSGSTRDCYTYNEYLQISKGISLLKEHSGYHLGFIGRFADAAIVSLIYVKDVPFPEPDAVKISWVSSVIYGRYNVTAIDGIDGYFSVSLYNYPDLFLGFIYQYDDKMYFFEIGYLARSGTAVSLLISPDGFDIPKVILDLDHLKILIDELNPELFTVLWKEYNLNK